MLELNRLCVLFIMDIPFLNQLEIPLLDRFAMNNLGETRFNLWLLGIKHLTTDFLGGKPYPLTMPSKTIPPNIYYYL
jgi:hypothetical protein